MNKMIKVLYDKKNRAVPFMEEDIALVKQIAVSGSPSGKIDLIFLLEEYIEEWSYEILRMLSKDSNETVRVHAITKLSQFLKTQDFWTLYEEFSDDTPFVTAAAATAVDYIGIEKEIDHGIRIRRLLEIKEKVPDSLVYVHLVIDAKLFLDTEEDRYLKAICRHRQDEDENVRLQVEDSINEIMTNVQDKEEIARKIREIAADNIEK